MSIHKTMSSFIFKISMFMFAMLHVGISTMMHIQGTPVAAGSMDVFIVSSAVSITTLFLLGIIPLMKMVHE